MIAVRMATIASRGIYKLLLAAHGVPVETGRWPEGIVPFSRRRFVVIPACAETWPPAQQLRNNEVVHD